MNPSVQSASDLRAEVARLQIARYKLAAQVGVHPGRLGQMLNEKIPLSSDLAARLGKALMTQRGQMTKAITD